MNNEYFECLSPDEIYLLELFRQMDDEDRALMLERFGRKAREQSDNKQ